VIVVGPAQNLRSRLEGLFKAVQADQAIRSIDLDARLNPAKNAPLIFIAGAIRLGIKSVRIARRWGNLSPEEMTHRFWKAVVYGVYATHGETYITTDGSPVWSDAGELHGTSAARITFLRRLLEKTGTSGLIAQENPYYLNAGDAGELILYYFDYHCVGEYEFPLPENVIFTATEIDPWAMTATPLPGTFSGKTKMTLSGKPYKAMLFEKA
jgi:hypothetical protein